MNATIEQLKPGPGLSLDSIPTTVEAVERISTALPALNASYEAVQRSNDERRARQERGVDCAGMEAAGWLAWQGTALRTFHAVRLDAAACAVKACESAIKDDADAIAEREQGIARGLGGLLHDQGAGADLAMLLKRVTGGLPVNTALHDTCAAWRRVHEHSRRALVELPPPPVRAPTNEDKTNELKTLLTKEN